MNEADETPVVAPPTNYYPPSSKQQQQLNTAELYWPRLKSLALWAPAINIRQLMNVYIPSSLKTLELEIHRDVFDL